MSDEPVVARLGDSHPGWRESGAATFSLSPGSGGRGEGRLDLNGLPAHLTIRVEHREKVNAISSNRERHIGMQFGMRQESTAVAGEIHCPGEIAAQMPV